MASRKPHPDVPIAHPYVRISDPAQRKGGGLERQLTADLGAWAERFGFKVGKRVWVDDGVSAFKGLNATPSHQLGQFLAEARKGLIRPGDCLLLENYDRLSRQDPWAAIGLVNELRQLGIHVGRLDRGKLLRCDSTDAGDFFEAAIEFMRGNSESAAKSMRNGAKWAKRREGARGEHSKDAILTRRLPAWIRAEGDWLVVIPERAEVVRRIFELSGVGYGLHAIVKTLGLEGVPAFGGREPVLGEGGRQLKSKSGRLRWKAPGGDVLGSGRWTTSYVDLILRDRRVLGEYQPRKGDRPDGDPIPDYFPRIISDEAWGLARLGAQQRHRRPGRTGRRVNLFSGLLKGPDGLSYVVAAEASKGRPHPILKSSGPRSGVGHARSFPLETFEEAVLSLLREIDAHQILNGDKPDDSLALAGQLAAVEEQIAQLEAELVGGDVPSLARVARALEARRKDLADRLAEAREKARHPLSESWGEAQTIAGALADAPDPRDARMRLRNALRRIIEEVVILVVPRGRDRLAAVQFWFAHDGRGQRRRDFLILHRPPKANAASRTEGSWQAVSLAGVVREGALDLRQKDHSERLEKALLQLDVEDLQ
jgi:hypothetical protein